MKKIEEFNCFWSHTCKKTKICCHFCKEKNCDWRCADFEKNCIYRDDEKEEKSQEVIINTEIREKHHNEIVEKSVKDKIIKYKKQNKLKNDDLAKRIGVNSSVIQKITSTDKIVRIRSDAHRKIKDFVKEIKCINKSSLW